MSRVLVAMSGGVDSSVAAALLVEAGHEVVGVTMKTFCYSDIPAHGKTCCGLEEPTLFNPAAKAAVEGSGTGL